MKGIKAAFCAGLVGDADAKLQALSKISKNDIKLIKEFAKNFQIYQTDGLVCKAVTQKVSTVQKRKALYLLLLVAQRCFDFELLHRFVSKSQFVCKAKHHKTCSNDSKQNKHTLNAKQPFKISAHPTIQKVANKNAGKQLQKSAK